MTKKLISLLLTLSLVFSVCCGMASAYQSDLVDEMTATGVEATAALLIDAETGLILFEQNAYDKVYPASITKVMTGLLIMEALEDGTLTLDQVITADSTAWEGLDSSSSNQNIQPGEQMTVEDLLYCLLVPSANEAGNILAVAACGSIEAFLERMNEKAEELGCTCTHFTNTHGMPDDDHYSTAYDIYLISRAALEYELFRTIVSTAEYTVAPTNLTETSRHFYNTNGLLSNLKYSGYYYKYCIGIKTGSTGAAGYCLVSAAEKDGRTLYCVMMGCENPVGEDGTTQRLQFSQSSDLFEWGFENFSVRTILDTSEPLQEVAVTLSTDSDYVSVTAAGTLEAYLPNDITAEDFEYIYNLPESVEAPITKGDVLGTLTLVLDGEEYGTVDLVALTSVEKSQILEVKSNIENFLSSTLFKLLLIAVVVLLVLMILLLFLLSRGRNRSSYRGNRRRRSNYRGRR